VAGGSGFAPNDHGVVHSEHVALLAPRSARLCLHPEAGTAGQHKIGPIMFQLVGADLCR
jgi:hypothetical protein